MIRIKYSHPIRIRNSDTWSTPLLFGLVPILKFSDAIFAWFSDAIFAWFSDKWSSSLFKGIILPK